MKLSKENKILIIGLGLIGGSYAKGLKSEGFYVGALSINPDDIAYALDNSIIDSGTTLLDEIYIKQFDVVIFALYPTTLINWIKENQHLLKKHAILTDVTGVKSSVIYEVQNNLRKDLTFIGAHPMAGKETSGVQNSDPSIFINANYIITPTDKNNEKDVEFAKNIGELLHFKNIVVLTPEKHDEMIAFLSQLTHCIAICLMTNQDCEHFNVFSGDSFRDLTRIAKINENMWPELFLMNKEKLLYEMDLFIKEMEKLKGYIINDNKEEIKQMMITSTERRKIFDK